MSKEQFTQGEWFISYGYVKIGDINYDIENRYDAHLIAAAPDMYNELKSLRAFLFGMTAYSEGSRLMAINQRILNIDDKLSKARGE